MRGGGGFKHFIVSDKEKREGIRISTNYFYGTLGFESYDCIDLDGAYNALAFNLNTNLANFYNYTNIFCLVTNFGTSEHILNQAVCFENIHNLCKENGIMIHALPISGYFNHGLFNYSLKFFMRLAVFNDYEFLSCKLLQVGVDNNCNTYIEHEKILRHLDDLEGAYEYLDSSKSMDLKYPHTSGGCGFNIVVAFKKTTNKPFSFPLDRPMFKYKTRETLKFFLKDKADSINSVAIFGSKVAASHIREFLESCGIEILCYIDDYNTGSINGIDIVSRDKFIQDYKDKCDFIFKGPLQRGEIDVGVEVIESKWAWFY